MSNPSENESIDRRTDTYLTERRGRKLEVAKQAELERVAEEEKTEAARQRKERELIEGGKVSPRGKEKDMETIEDQIVAAANVAATATAAGVEPGEAIDLAIGSKKVVVVKPKAEGELGKEAGGWTVLGGKPVKDPEGEYTFSQALKVAALEAAKHSDNPMDVFKFLKDEGFLEGKKDDFMNTFMTELAKKSVDNLVHPSTSGSSGSSSEITSLKEELARLREEIRTASNPVEAAKRVKETFDIFKTVGLIPEPTGGTNLEALKETHRHAETMEAITADKKYKESIIEIASTLPQKIGHGLAGRIMEGESGEGGSSSESKLETFICTKEDCSYEFHITPETGSQITCPKCGTIYARKKASEG